MDTFTDLPPQLQEPTGVAPFQEWLSPDGGFANTWFYRTPVGYLLRYGGVADFLVSNDGRQVSCRAVPGIGNEKTQHLYLNQVVPLIQSKSGQLVFHASVIEAEGSAIAFAAESGRGKSTLAASFASNGFRFLTDDGLLLEETATGYMAQPSHAFMRLWRDSQDALIGEAAELALPVAYTSKARILSGAELAHCNEARSLRRVYFLGDGSAAQITIRAMAPSEALIALVTHSFLMDMDQPNVLARNFEQLTRMVAAPIFFHLDYPRRYDALAEVRRVIIKHARSKGGRGCMKLSDKVTIPPQVMVRQVGVETVILDLASGGYFGLDDVGARCWQLLSEGLSLAECCDRILDEYDAPRDQVERDVLFLVEQLAERDLVASV